MSKSNPPSLYDPVTQGSDIIRIDFMEKKAQVRSRFTSDNYKFRWFILTSDELRYYDGSQASGYQKMKGSIRLSAVQAIETVNDDQQFSAVNMFQVVYTHEADRNVYILYIKAPNENKREEWIRVLRRECKAADAEFSAKYHPGMWIRKLGQFTCCNQISRFAPGCKPSFIESNNLTAPSLAEEDHRTSTVLESPPSPTQTRHSSNDVFAPQQNSTVTKRGSGNGDPVVLFKVLARFDYQPQQNDDLELNRVVFKDRFHCPVEPVVQTTRINQLPVLTLVGPEQQLKFVEYFLESLTKPAVAGTGPATAGFPRKTEIWFLFHPNGLLEVCRLDLKDTSVDDFGAMPVKGLIKQGDEYEILDDASDKFWWRARNRQGQIGYIPANYVDHITEHGLEKYAWYYGNITRQDAQTLLMKERKEGCYLIRNATSPGTFSLTVTCIEGAKDVVKHYHIKQNSEKKYFFSERHAFITIPELVEYHSYNAGGIITRLRTTPNQRYGVGHQLSEKWEIDVEKLNIQEQLGKGEFGTVYAAVLNGSIRVAVKMLKPGTMTEDKFIEEAETMTKIKAPHLVTLYGLCVNKRPIYIVTEYMKYGSLQTYLGKNKTQLMQRPTFLLDTCLQVCKGMVYLESHGFIHRDLAARNCLVGEQYIIKVADFGLARFVLDDEYTSSNGAKFPIRWASPEVLNFCRFSSKSDVWAFGVLMWEVFSFGDLPYSQLNNTQVCEVLIEQKHRLTRPRHCNEGVYQIMRKCWAEEPERRPMFSDLEREIESVKHPEISI